MLGRIVQSKSYPIIFIASVVSIGLSAYLRVMSLPPQLYPDEFLYKLLIMDTQESSLPNFFYALVYKPITFCGTDFYACSRLLNTFLFVVLSIVTYFLAKRFLDTSLAYALMLFFGLGPIAGYVALLSPEILFYLLSAIILLVFTFESKFHFIQFWSLIGALTGMLLMTKPHALFMTAAILLYMVFQSIRQREVKMLFITLFTYLSTAYLVAVLIKLIAVGTFTVNPLASRYSRSLQEVGNALGGNTENLRGEQATPFELLQRFLEQSGLHLALVIALCSAGVIVMFAEVLKLNSGTSLDATKLLFVFTVVTFLVGTASFSAFSAFWGESLHIRLMPRYYEHLLYLAPIFLLSSNVWKQKWVWIFGSAFSLVILVLQSSSMYIFPFDSYLVGVWRALGLPLWIIALGTLILSALMLTRFPHQKQFYAGFLVVIVVYFNFHMVLFNSQLQRLSSSIQAVRELQVYLDSKTDNIVIVSTTRNEFNRILFWQTQTFDNQVEKRLTKNEIESLQQKYSIVVALPEVRVASNLASLSMGAISIFEK